MKILIAADIFPPESGGPATYCVALANELVKRGNEVKIVSLNPDGQQISHITYHVSQRNKFLKYLQYTYLLWKHGKDVDIIYAMGPVNAGLPALIVAKLRRKKFVVKVVGDYAWEQFQNAECRMQNVEFVGVEKFQDLKVSGKTGLLKKIERFVAKNTDKIIVPSGYLKTVVFRWGVKAEKIEIIYNAVKFKEVDPIKHEGERWLVSVGRLVPWKGFDTLIEMMPELLKDFPNLRLKIIGDGPDMENIKYRISNIRLDDSVELVGALSHDKTLSYIKSADLFILNSGYEGLSHVILEALSFNKIVLASAVDGNAELVFPYANGSIFPFNDKVEIIKHIKRALEQPYNTEKWMKTDAAKQIFERFRFNYMMLHTLDVFKSLCN